MIESMRKKELMLTKLIISAIVLFAITGTFLR